MMPAYECYLNPDLCGSCGGKCCKTLPGACMPDDFQRNGKPLLGTLAIAFGSGGYAIDWWEGDPREGIPDNEQLARAYFVRPAVDTDGGRLFCGSWGGKCVFLTVDGCRLDPQDRPSGCRLLEPKPLAHDCEVHGASKQDAAIAWLPHTKTIEEAAHIARKQGAR